MKCSELPVGTFPKALEFNHFPTVHQAVVFRNFNLVPLSNLAAVLGCTPDEVRACGEAMGLRYDGALETLWMERGFLTILHNNWHLLNYEQLLTLLNWSPEQLSKVLLEEDFAWIKLGCLKPDCAPVHYRALTAKEAAATEELRAVVAEQLTALDRIPGEKPFDFLHLKPRMDAAAAPPSDQLRMLYSYSAPCGDPLLDEELDPYPDNMLQAYAQQGVNAVWFQAILYTLVPWLGELELSQGWERRLQNLRKLVARAKRYGIKIYLYLNEPRAIPEPCFRNFPEWGGTVDKAHRVQCFCPSQPAMLEALERGIRRLCAEVPELGGFFTITMSENPTHCLSRAAEHPCPRCQDRSPAENIVAVMNALERGIRASGSAASLTAWNWGWDPAWDAAVIEKLHPDINIMCVSETGVETDCYGIKGSVIDYSIAHPGPGPVARRLWKLAQNAGHKCIAKIQINCTWEMSAVPYIPVPQLIAGHLERIRAEGVTDFMLGWTLGGYPGGNLELLDCPVEVLAERNFGKEAAATVVEAWALFSEGFRHFPFNSVDLIYNGPQNIGAANLLAPKPTGYRATMVKGFPYDDLDHWRGRHYPPEILERAFDDLCRSWQTGLALLRPLENTLTNQKLANLRELALVAEAVFVHFASSLNQIRYIMARDRGDTAAMHALADAEFAVTKRQSELAHQDSRIGFEAANHYYYTQNNLLEKLLNCRQC